MLQVAIPKDSNVSSVSFPGNGRAAVVLNTLGFLLAFAIITMKINSTTNLLGGYQKELLKIIDADQLPVFLGGNMKDPDGNVRCVSKVSAIFKLLKQCCFLDGFMYSYILRPD